MASGNSSNSPPPPSHSDAADPRSPLRRSTRLGTPSHSDSADPRSPLRRSTRLGAPFHKPRSNCLTSIQNRPFMDTNPIPANERPYQRRKKAPTPTELAAMFAAIEVPCPGPPRQMPRPRFPWEPRPEPRPEPSRRQRTFFKPLPFAWKESTHEKVMPHNKKRKLMFPSAEAWEMEMKRRQNEMLLSNGSRLIWWMLFAMVLIGGYACWLSYMGSYQAESQLYNDVIRLTEEDKFIREQQQGEPPETTEFDNKFDTPEIKEFGGMANYKRAVTMDELHSMGMKGNLEEEKMSREHSIKMIQEEIKRREEEKDNIEDVD